MLQIGQDDLPLLQSTGAELDSAATYFDIDASGFTGSYGFIGDSFADSVLGGDSADSLTGGGDGDLLSGADGADTLVGGAGADTLTGGDGNDLFVIERDGTNLDRITDFGEGDRLVLTGRTQAGTLTAGDGTVMDAFWVQVEIVMGDGAYLHFNDDSIPGAANASVFLSGDYSLGNFEQIGTTLAFVTPIFTTGDDSYVDGTGNALTVAAATGTINEGDSVDAGDGVDTLNATLEDGEITGAATLTGWENLNIAVASGASAEFDALNVSGSTIKPVGAGLHSVYNAGVDVDASGLTGDGRLSAVISGGDVSVVGGANDDYFSFGTSLGSGDTIVGGLGSDTLEARLSGPAEDAGAPHISGVESIELVGAGSSSTIDLTNVTGATDLVLFATRTASLAVSNIAGSITNIQGSNAAGPLRLELSNAADVFLDGGRGSDLFDFATTLDSADTIIGGLGEDTVTAVLATDLDSTTGALRMSGVETLRLAGYGTANDISLANVMGLATLTLAGSAAMSITDIIGTVTRIDAGSSQGPLSLDLSNAADLLLLGGSGADSLDFTNTLDSGDTIVGGSGADTIEADIGGLTAATGALRLSGVETLKLTGSGTGTLDLTASSGIQTVVLSGTLQATLTGFSSSVALDATGLGAGGYVDVAFGGGDDRGLGSDFDDRLSGGAGADTLVGGLGADTLTGGDGNDLFVIEADGSNLDRITDFGEGDRLMLTGRTQAGTLTAGNGTVMDAFGVQVEIVTGEGAYLHFNDDSISGAADASVFLSGDYSLANFEQSGTDLAFVVPIFTTGTDSYVDGTGNTLTATAATGTINQGDSVDAGDGIDTLTVTLDDGEITGAATLTGWENLNIAVASGASAEFDAQNVSGSTIKPVGAGLHTISDASVDIDASGLTGDGRVRAFVSGGDVSVVGGANDDYFFLGTSLSGADTIVGGLGSDTVDGSFNGLSATPEALHISGVEFLKLGGAGSSSIVDLTNVTGATDLFVPVRPRASLTITNIASSITNIQGSTASGFLRLELANAADVFLEGGSGSGLFDFTTTLDSADTIIGGAGEDTVTAVLAADLDSTTGALRMSGVETLSLAGYGTANDISLANVTGLATLTLAGSAAMSITDIIGTVTRIDAGSSQGPLTLDLSNAADLLLLGGSGADSLDFTNTLSSGDTIVGGAGADTIEADIGGLTAVTGALRLSGVETLDLTGAGAGTLDLTASSGIQTVVLAGTLQATLTGFSSSVALDATGLGAGGYVDVTFGGGNDHGLGSGFDDRLLGGAGADTLAGGDGSDTLSGGGGIDVFVFEAIQTGQDLITDFGVGGRDVIFVEGATFNGSVTAGDGSAVAANSIQVGAVSGGVTTIYVNTQSTAGAAQLTIRLQGSYTAANFALSGGDIRYVVPPSLPPKGSTTVDGVKVGTGTKTNSDGTTSTVVTIPVVTDGRNETVGGNTVADIPLVSSGGASLLSAQVPTGLGLTVSGNAAPKTAGDALTDLIREIREHTEAGSADQTQLTGGGSGFLSGIPADTPLLVQTIVPAAAPGATASGEPLVITGTPATAGNPYTALVIDTRGLPSGTVIQLQNVEFAAVIGAVRVTGGEGSQNVWGDGEAQYIVLGADDDTLHGGGGDDYVGSKTGNDLLFGDGGADTVTGGEDDDIVYGNQQDDMVYGNQGNDTLYGGQDQDIAFGGQGNDVVYGNRGQDVVYGNKGADTLFGGQADDVLFGGQGDDVLFGKLGDDRLTGGLGADLFAFNEGSGRDLITDFRFEEGDRLFADGRSWTVSDGAAGAVVDFGAGDKVTLASVRAGQVTEAWFKIA